MARVNPGGMAVETTSSVHTVLNPIPAVKRRATKDKVKLSASKGTRILCVFGTVADDMTDTAIALEAIVLTCIPAYVVNLVLNHVPSSTQG